MGAGFNATTLAVFTGLAPAGMLAFFLMGAYASFAAMRDRGRLAQANLWLAIPLAVAWLGFIASATHLGMPSNALYVVAGVGRSPLSNEVVAVMGFLFFSGVYWLYSFKRKRVRFVSCALMIVAMLFALLGVAFSSVAYSIGTVESWDVWYTPVNLWLTGIAGAGALTTASFLVMDAFGPVKTTGSETEGDGVWDSAADLKWHRVFLAMSLAAIVASAIVMWMQAGFFAGVTNHVAGLTTFADGYLRTAFLHAGVCLAGWALQVTAILQTSDKRVAAVVSSAGFVVLMAGILMARFAFYDAYISVGF